ncbi:MAG: YraN family protein [Candidatus Hydrothermota bacterium]|nr:MAG: YraN family protein [Candidatus Hydrothermae bacterium]
MSRRRRCRVANGKARRKGRWGEEIAAKFLENKGLKIIGRNYTKKFGEIDIIAMDGDVLVFVEVKAAVNPQFHPIEQVTKRKQRILKKMAEIYLAENELLGEVDCRFDVVTVQRLDDKIVVEHFPDAFGM